MSDQTASGGTWKSPFYNRTPGAQTVARSLSLGNKLRDKVRNGLAFGAFIIDLPNPSTITALSIAGFDFVVLDMEHSAVDFSALEGLINAARAAGITALVRPWGQGGGLIGKIFDMGAHGVMVPHVDGPDQAKSIVDQARFSPLGNRGFAPLSKFDCFEQPLKLLDESGYVVVQIEGRAAIDRVEEIAAVPGIDTIFVGPYDLALSLGVDPGSETVFHAAQKIAEAVPDHLGLGIYIDNPETSKEWASRGFAFQCISFDGRMLSDGARNVIKIALG